MKTKKSLGQIAFEYRWRYRHDVMPWFDLPRSERMELDREANAVAREVRRRMRGKK